MWGVVPSATGMVAPSLFRVNCVDLTVREVRNELWVTSSGGLPMKMDIRR